MDAPDRTKIIEARQRAGQTQTAAATSVHAALRSWQQWEAGDRAMPAATWELYMLKSGQHPDCVLMPRAK